MPSLHTACDSRQDGNKHAVPPPPPGNGQLRLRRSHDEDTNRKLSFLHSDANTRSCWGSEGGVWRDALDLRGAHRRGAGGTACVGGGRGEPGAQRRGCRLPGCRGGSGTDLEQDLEAPSIPVPRRQLASSALCPEGLLPPAPAEVSPAQALGPIVFLLARGAPQDTRQRLRSRAAGAGGTKAVSAAAFVAAENWAPHACPSGGRGLSKLGRDLSSLAPSTFGAEQFSAVGGRPVC